MVEINYKKISDFDIKGKKILVRIDINSSIDLDKMEIRSDPRIQAAAPALKSLKDAAVVIIAHQSRFGKKDCIDLELHAKQLQKYVDQPVKFVKDLFGAEAIAAIKELKVGEILVLNNVRMWETETKIESIEAAEKSDLITNLAPLFDYYVNDAFGAAHRAHVSLTGWPTIVAGKIVEKELAMVKKLFTPEKPSVWVVGGAKAIDKYRALKFNLEAGTIDKACIAGLTATLMLESLGLDCGASNRKLIQEDLDKYGAEIKETCEKFADKIILPVDFAYESNGERKEADREVVAEKNLGTGDLGAKSIELFKIAISKAKTIVSNGPPGIFEMEVYKKSSFEVVDAMADAAKNGAYVVIGGGEMGAVATMAGLGDKVIISTGGGALLQILSGKDLPLLKVLRNKQPNK